jgi:regulatory protein
MSLCEQIANVSEVYKRALKYITASPKTSAELSRYLTKCGFHQSSIETVLNQFILKGWLDDLSFSQRFIEKAVREKKKGRIWIEQALLKKGVESDVITSAFTDHLEIDEFTELNEALQFAKKTLLSSRFSSGSIPQKMFQTLARRGYSDEIIEQVFRALKLDLS